MTARHNKWPALLLLAAMLLSLVPVTAADAAPVKVSGTAFGTSPAWNNGTSTYEKAFDGNTSTFFDYSNGDGGYTGIDLGNGNAKVISKIRFHPRAGYEGRMTGGKFQGSNTGTGSGYTDLVTVSSTPSSGWNELTVTGTAAYRYLRYLSPNGGFTNVSEVEFYTESSGSGTGTGLKGEYFNGTGFNTPVLTRTDATIDFNWGGSAPAAGVNADNFSVRWTGQIEPQYSQTYTFYTTTDDGARLWVNGQLIIDKWVSQPATEWSGSIALTAGQKVDIRLEHYDGCCDASAKLSWSSASQAKQVVPSSRLYPASGGGSGGSGSNYIGINIDTPFDYTTQKTFVDAMKQSRGFHNPGDLNNKPALDANGWPLADAETIVIESVSNIGGTYKLSFNGQADTISVNGGGTVTNKSYNSGTNTTTADVVMPSSANQLWLKFQGTRQTASSAVNTGIKNIKLIRPGYDPNNHPVFTNDIKDLIDRFDAIRFMDFTATNSNIQVNWSDRTLPSYATQAPSKPGYGWQGVGAAWEYVILLANETGKDAWICVPAKASDDYIYQLAQLFKNGSTVNGVTYPGLNSGLKLYVEYSNEVWNSAPAFQQFFHNRDLAIAEVNAGGSPLNYDGSTSDVDWLFRRVGKRTVDISNTFRSVFGDSAMMTRVRPILSGQLGNPSVLDRQISFIHNYYNNGDGNHVGNPHPVHYFIYGAGGSGYYDPDSSIPNITVDQLFNTMPHHWASMIEDEVKLTAAYGVKRIAYEGGPSLEPANVSEAVKNAAYTDPRMKQEVIDNHNLWSSLGGDLFMYFNSGSGTNHGFTWPNWNTNTQKLQGIDAIQGQPRAALTIGAALPGTVATNQFYARTGWANNYLMRSASAGTYNLVFDYESGNNGNIVQVIVNGDIIGSYTLNSSGGWGTRTNSAAIPITVKEGLNGLRVRVVSGDVNFHAIKVN